MELKFQEITVEGENPDISVVQLMRAGTFDYYGDGTKMEITSDMFRSFKKNFDAKTLGVDIAIDYFHNAYNEAAGWIREIMLRENDTQLWLKVEWTDRAKEKILAKEIRYLSADFTTDWKNPETHVKHGPTLFGGGLTNRPFLKNMSAILHERRGVFDKNELRHEDINNSLQKFKPKKGQKMEFTEIKQAAIVLSDAQKQELGALIGLAPKDVKLAEEVTSLRAQLVAKTTEAETLTKQLADQKKEAEFSVLMSEGKAVEAQKAAYLTGNMAEFLKLAVPVNLDPKGSGDGKFEDKAGEPKTAAEAEAKVEKLAEAKRAEDKTLSVAESIKIVLSENVSLKKLLG